jgi:hypothetical protein
MSHWYLNSQGFCENAFFEYRGAPGGGEFNLVVGGVPSLRMKRNGG